MYVNLPLIGEDVESANPPHLLLVEEAAETEVAVRVFHAHTPARRRASVAIQKCRVLGELTLEVAFASASFGWLISSCTTDEKECHTRR